MILRRKTLHQIIKNILLPVVIFALGLSASASASAGMGGHAGKAFWYSKPANGFVTSSYYYDEYPKWVADWNAKKKPERYSGGSWKLLHPKDDYLFRDRDDQAWEVDLQGFGRVFPHNYSNLDNPYYTTYLTISPAGDELTAEFAIAAIEAEQIGADNITDFLGVSFSSTDYIGHFF